jgi:peptidyl-tRNA hydrolase
MKKIKIFYRKNLKMTPGKIAAQCVHAALGLRNPDPMMSVIVLGVSDKKFKEYVEWIKEYIKDVYKAEECSNSWYYLVKDLGYTEVPAGTETALAIYEKDNEMR